MRIHDDRSGWDKVKGASKALDALKIQAGIFREAGSPPEGPELPVAAVLFFHEYGHGVPERSVIREGVRVRVRMIEEAYAKHTANVLAGKIGAIQAAGQIGELVAELFRKRIRDRIPPPLDPATIRRKGSTMPLIDTGQLIQSLTSRVIK